jgi:hypothetical protein
MKVYSLTISALSDKLGFMDTNAILILVDLSNMYKWYIFRHAQICFHCLINMSHHISFDSKVKFIDQMIKTNFLILKYLSHLCTIDLSLDYSLYICFHDKNDSMNDFHMWFQTQSWIMVSTYKWDVHVKSLIFS